MPPAPRARPDANSGVRAVADARPIGRLDFDDERREVCAGTGSRADGAVAYRPRRRGAADVDMKLEVVVVPVSDVDRAKGFYESLGWRLDADFPGDGGFRVVQLTPPGSACSIIFGSGVTSAAPGSAEGLQLVVTDIEAARAELVDRGVEVSEVFHDTGGVFHHAGTRHALRARLQSTRPMARLPRSAIRTATAGFFKR